MHRVANFSCIFVWFRNLSRTKCPFIQCIRIYTKIMLKKLYHKTLEMSFSLIMVLTVLKNHYFNF